MISSAWLGSLVAIPMALYQARQQARRFVVFGYTRFLVQVTVQAGLVAGMGMGALGVVLGQFAAALFFGVFVTRQAWREWRVWPVSGDWFRKALVFSLPLLPHGLCSWIIDASDRMIVERSLSLEQAGLYSLGYTIGSIALIAASSVNQSYSPHYLREMGRDSAAGRRLSGLYQSYTLGFCALALTGVLWVREALGLVLPERHLPALVFAVPVIAAAPFSVFYYFSGNPLFFCGKTAVFAITTTVAAGLNLVLNLVLVPRYGAMICAWTTVIGFAAMFAVTDAAARRLCPADSVPRARVWLPGLYVAGAAAMVCFWTGSPAALVMIKLMFMTVFGFAAYLWFRRHQRRQNPALQSAV